MTDAATHQTNSVAQNQGKTAPVPKKIQKLAVKLAIATFILMAIGSATRVTNAGLACPDWPLCYGTLLPVDRMNLQVFLEWFHRLDAAIIGVGTLWLAGRSWWHRHNLPNWVPWTATAALAVILLQGLLGGLTVTEMLRFDIVTAHLGTALLFFTTILVMALVLSPYEKHAETATPRKLTWISAIAVLLVYLQSLLGALVGSRWAAHQCLQIAQLCSVLHSHLMGVVPASMSVLVLAIVAVRTPHLPARLRRLNRWGMGLLLVQIALGFATLHMHLQVEILTVAHQSVGAALLGVLVAFTVYGIRDRLTPPVASAK
jgi:cytochrome c oxidase assembly protein subunit 15